MVHACLSSYARLVTNCINFPQPPYLGNTPGGGGGGGGGGEVVVHMAVVGEGPPDQGST